MKSEICFSVIVPIFNAEKYLDRCIKSIINQSYSNLEIILIDDGSTDRSLEMCKGYAESDSRITLIHQENSGLVYSRKVGIKNSKGDYISFVDADDSIVKDMYSTIVENMKEDQPDVIAFGLKEIYENNNEIIKKNNFRAGYYNHAEIVKSVFPTMICTENFFEFGILPNLVCKVIKRNFLDNITIHVSDIVTVGEDADFSFQIISQAESLQIMDLVPYNYFKNRNSMMFKSINPSMIDALENDLENCFKNIGLFELFKDQLNTYITFVKALKSPDSINVLKSFFSKIEISRCALYGAGGFGIAIKETFYEKVSLWADREFEFYNKTGMSVISPQEFCVQTGLYDLVFIAVLNSKICESIAKDLKNKGQNKQVFFFDGKSIIECLY